MSELNEANAVLSDVEKRAAYDSIGENRQCWNWLLRERGCGDSVNGPADCHLLMD
jgi:curved DNA-binding protein CbpA